MRPAVRILAVLISGLMMSACSPAVFINADASRGFDESTGFLPGSPQSDRLIATSRVRLVAPAHDDSVAFTLTGVQGTSGQVLSLEPDTQVIHSINKRDLLEVYALFSVSGATNFTLIMSVGDLATAPYTPIQFEFKVDGTRATARIIGSDEAPQVFNVDEDLWFYMQYSPATGAAFPGIFQSGVSLWDRLTGVRMRAPGLRWELLEGDEGSAVYVREAWLREFPGYGESDVSAVLGDPFNLSD